MRMFLIITFLFLIGSILGWGIEVVFRRLYGDKKWVNPGFLVGPYLPLYGFGLVGLYFLSLIDLSFINNFILELLLRGVIIVFSMTLLEFITGLIFIKGMNIKLWDYSNNKWNIKGIICPLFSFFWLVIGLLYYYLLHPFILELIHWYIFENLAYAFIVGIFYGFIIVDLVYSFNLSTKIRKLAKDNIIIIKYEELKVTIQNHLRQAKEKIHYWRSFKSNLSLKEMIEKYKEQKEKERKDKEK